MAQHDSNMLGGFKMSYDKGLGLGVVTTLNNTLAHLILLILDMGIQKPIIIVMHEEFVPPR